MVGMFVWHDVDMLFILNLDRKLILSQGHKCNLIFFNIMPGHKGQLAPRCRALDAMIKKLYHGIQKAVHQFRFKNVEQHLLLGSGGEPKSKTQL